MEKLKVISFVGPSGSGKSTAIKKLSKKFNILEERYIELNTHNLDNRLMLSKWAYCQYWFGAILNAKKQNRKLLLTDRCPLDACAYIRNGRHDLLEVINLSLAELDQLNISVIKILVIADFDVLQDRIDRRLKIDDRRIKYNEQDLEHNKVAYNFYIDNLNLWDLIIDTTIINKYNFFDVFNSAIEKFNE